MGVVEYTMMDALRCYGGEPPESVLDKYGDVGTMVWCHSVVGGDVLKVKESGMSYFRVYRYSYPFSVEGGFLGMSENELLLLILSGYTLTGGVTIFKIMSVLKWLRSAEVYIHYRESGAECLRKAMANIYSIERYLIKRKDADYGFSVFVLSGLRRVITDLILRLAGGNTILTISDNVEVVRTVRFCKYVIIGMMTRSDEVLPLPENLEK